VLLTCLRRSRVAAIGPSGHARLTGGAEKSLVYVTQTDAGEQETLTPEEFRKKYNWRD
jgi:hypothetical protein